MADDEHWFDYGANIVDNQHVIDHLTAASDYERGFSRLDHAGEVVIKKLGEWAGRLACTLTVPNRFLQD